MTRDALPGTASTRPGQDDQPSVPDQHQLDESPAPLRLSPSAWTNPARKTFAPGGKHSNFTP